MLVDCCWSSNYLSLSIFYSCDNCYCNLLIVNSCFETIFDFYYNLSERDEILFRAYSSWGWATDLYYSKVWILASNSSVLLYYIYFCFWFSFSLFSAYSTSFSLLASQSSLWLISSINLAYLSWKFCIIFAISLLYSSIFALISFNYFSCSVNLSYFCSSYLASNSSDYFLRS